MDEMDREQANSAVENKDVPEPRHGCSIHFPKKKRVFFKKKNAFETILFFFDCSKGCEKLERKTEEKKKEEGKK